MRPHGKVDTPADIHDGKSGGMMLAAEYSSASDAVEEGVGVAARNKYTLALNARRIRPLDCDPMCGILARQAQFA